MVREQAGQQGFSLVEIMIAVAIFAIGILGVGAMQVKSINTDSQSSRITEVVTTLEQLMERLTSLGFNDPSLCDVDGDGSNEDATENPFFGPDCDGDGVPTDLNGDGVIELGGDLNDNGVVDDVDQKNDPGNGIFPDNGVDDNDEPPSNQVPPPPLRDFGLNDTAGELSGGSLINTADYTETIGRFTVYWNVAVNEPTKGCKTIRAIIFWTEGGRQRQITLDSVKPST